MKKIVLPILIVIIFILSSCITNPYYDKYIQYDDIKIGKKFINDLEHPFTLYELTYRNDTGAMLSNHLTTTYSISYYKTQSSQDFYSMDFVLSVQEWYFHDGEVKIKVNDKLYKFLDKNPKRDVVSADILKETISITVGQDFIDDVKSCDSINIQFYGEPKSLTNKEVSQLQSFIDFTVSL